ncbi:SH3 domain-containing protein [Microbacterium sp. KSW4-11]|uniref:SH3 domain-containing protein n=1 Tax=Microbacterium gawkjiense TaxID=3067309 RepID=A0ABU3GDL8_9MICO|nr:SH3 domain-containing protein [Microbacterium sp. KSW4-11]MDT3317899.1 SH3 domain-containing protein [Microbacterium sp. KSW4-11]
MRLSVSVPRRPLRSLAILLATVLSLSVLMAVAPASTATAADPRLPSTIEDGGFIISDAEYFNGGSMTAAQAQTFLEARVPSCKATSGPTCLRNFTADIPAKAKDAYCAAIPKKAKVRAAEIIVTVGKACGLSPKVILVMLQKEQGLVTSTKPSEWSYRAAMGMNCPDTAPCSAASAGFFNQVYLGARQQQVYANNPTKYGYRKGQVATVKWHPNSACGTSKVLIKNQATANLYIYTPYRPNMAALAAGYATGDGCSSYGNRNFYNYYVQWFAPEVNRWGSGAAARVDVCTAPKAADIVPASSVATVTAATTARKAPSTLCAAGSSSVAKSAKVTVTGTYGSWARATVGSTSMWIAKSALSIASGTPAGNPCAVPAESSVTKAGGTITVVSENLRARKAPSLDCATGFRWITAGQKYERTGIYGVWWRIQVAGSTYWSHSDFMTVEEKPPAKTMYLATTTNMTPSVSSATIQATLRKGSTVTTLAVSGDRTQITVGGMTGWVFSSKLSTKNPGAVGGQDRQVIASTPLRATASASGKVLSTLKVGTKVTVHDTFGAWRAVTAGSTKGWMRDSELQAVTKTMYLSAPDNVAPSATSTTIQATLRKGTAVVASTVSGTRTQIVVDGTTGWVTTAKLVATNPGGVAGQDRQSIAATPLRATASASGKVLSTLKAGTKVTVYDGYGAWRAVTAGSTKGWMRDSELQAVSTAKTMYLATTTNMTPSVSSAAIQATLRKGTTVKALSVSGDRTQVTVDGMTGWVFSSKLSTKNPGAVGGQDRQVVKATPLRATASASGKVLSTLKAGTKVTVHDTFGIWRAVTAGSTKGWMRDSELQAISTAKTMYLATTTNMTPSVSSKAIQATLRKGTTVKALSVSGDRTQITVDGMTGWVFTSKLSTKNPGAVGAQDRQVIASTPLRATASASGKVLSTLKAGTKVTVHDTFGIWRAVTAGSTKGWMRDSELKKLTAAPATSVKTTTSALNLRQTPSTSGKILVVIPKGTKVTITASSGIWRKTTFQGKTGWVSSDFLR